MTAVFLRNQLQTNENSFRKTGSAQRHVALFVMALTQGGVGRVMLNLAEFLVSQGHRVDLVVVRKTGEYLEQLPDGVRLVTLGGGRVIFSVPRLARYLRREQPESLISGINRANLGAIWARALARAKTKIIVTEHTALSADIPNAPRRRDRLLPSLIQRFYPKANAIVAVSHGVADDLAYVTGLDRASIEVIYNPVIPDNVAEKMEPAPNHPWFSDGGPPIILGVGRLTAPKDFPTLLRAFAVLRQSRPARLMILGEGEARPELERWVRELAIGDHVALPGYVDKPLSYLSRANLFVLSSRWEGLPTVLIEALACGTPVVATDCPSGPAEILEKGRWGPLTPVGDIEALSAAMADVLRHPLDGDLLCARAGDFAVRHSAMAYERLLARQQTMPD